MKYFNYILLVFVALTGFTSCSDDDPTEATIFPTDKVERDAFDEWLLKNYTYPYNVAFKYKMQDIESDMKYNLVPADSAKASKLAIIVKYMWFDAYTEALGADFVKENVPRVIHLIGSPAYNSEGTIVLGTAEGGLKVTLYMVNLLSDAVLRDYATLNEYYFHTMHHEFTHILNQRKPFNKAFEKVSESEYISGDWYAISEQEAHSKGFVSAYAMSEPREDFAEIMSIYVTSSTAEWNSLIADAGDGADIINEKLEMLRAYMQEQWNLDINNMREIVMHRASEMKHLDLEHLN